jgi:Ca2+/H+ antiporter
MMMMMMMMIITVKVILFGDTVLYITFNSRSGSSRWRPVSSQSYVQTRQTVVRYEIKLFGVMRTHQSVDQTQTTALSQDR